LVAVTIHYTIQNAAFGDGALQFGKVNPYEVISQVSYQIVTRVTMILLVTLFVIAAYGIKFLHRVAGPIYRCRKTLITLNQGKVPDPIRLRSGDFFTEVADEINRQSEIWAGEVRKKEELVRQIDALAKSSVAPDVRARLETLRSLI
jgi:signal transduction histidine kinase